MRSKNSLYKVNMEVESSKCLQFTKIGDTAIWHARFGHVSINTMKSMMDKEIITGMPNISNERELCASCLVGKQTRAPKATTY